MTQLEVRQPSFDECNAKARIDVGGERLAFATWYPQMGGYGALCVVVSGNNANPGDDPSEACFDAYIWHDGDFPYSAETDLERLGYARAPRRSSSLSRETVHRFRPSGGRATQERQVMKVGEIGFVIKKSDGSYVGRKTRSHPERPFRTWGEANEARGGKLPVSGYGAPYSGEITMVQLVPIDPILRDMALPTAAITPASTPAETYTVVLKSCGPNKISVIKLVREITRSGLKDAKDLVDRAPEDVKTGVLDTEAVEIARKLRDAGAEVEFKITGDR